MSIVHANYAERDCESFEDDCADINATSIEVVELRNELIEGMNNNID